MTEITESTSSSAKLAGTGHSRPAVDHQVAGRRRRRRNLGLCSPRPTSNAARAWSINVLMDEATRRRRETGTLPVCVKCRHTMCRCIFFMESCVKKSKVQP